MLDQSLDDPLSDNFRSIILAKGTRSEQAVARTIVIAFH